MNKYIDRINKIKETPEYIAEAISNELAKNIENKLDEQNIKHKDFAKKLKVSKPYVSQILQGQSNMTILTLCKIACALEMKIDINFAENTNHLDANDYISTIKNFALASVDSFDDKSASSINEVNQTDSPDYLTNYLKCAG